MNYNFKPKLYNAVTIALISAGFIPTTFAEVNDLDVNNPNGTTITNSATGNAVDLDNGGSFTVINNGTISASATNNAYGVNADSSTTITTLSNTKTITGTASNSNGYGIGITSTLTSLTNSGTISGTAANDLGRGFSLHAGGTITNLTNSGTISGTAGDDNGNGVYVTSSSTLTNLTNSGTISGTAYDEGYGVRVNSNSTLTNLTNSGTISGTAADDKGYGVNVGSTSTLTNLTNTGTITGTATTSAFDIKVGSASNLVNLNNLQSDLSYNGRLPRNYKTIIQGSNYGSLAISGTPTESSTGDTVYTPFAGSSNIGVYIPSGSYTNVMTGMPDANLHSTVSGTLTGDGTDSVGTVNWALTETSSGSNNWNLTTSGGSYTYIGKDNTQSAINQTTKNVGGVFQNVSAGGNFANMTTYDCDLFNGRENCISVGGRVTESSGKDTSIVLVAGQKINENLRIGGYIDQTINHDNYNDINIDVNVPLIGAMAVWNESADQQGLQLKFSNSYQSNDAEITRAVVGTSELAKGDTTIETQSYIAEASYRIENAVSDITLKPFGAVRYMKTELDSYTEKNIGAPVTYSEMDEENVAVIVGIKAYHDLSSKVKLNASLGLEHDLNNNDAELKGTISGISAFNSSSIGNDKNDTRALASLGAHLYLDHGDRVEVKGMYQELRYKKDDATTVYITYTLPF